MPDADQKNSSSSDPRRSLVSVSDLLEHPEAKSLISTYSRPATVAAIQEVLAAHRKRIQAEDAPPTSEDILEQAQSILLPSEEERLRPVINATGILLHTGLGRAVLPRSAADALAGLDRCCNLQIDLESGERGKRNFTTEQLLVRLTGAEAAMVVTNNAAATLLMLSALCKNKEVIVSRGQLIEIGGSYRLPDCIHQSGALLVEVGTTNKTHLRDYASALTDETAVVMRVNPSNYRIIGFSREVPISELAGLKKERDVLVFDDLGCGALVDLSPYGLPHEPTVQDSITAGADLVCFSGDKLLGGPQAGIIVGRKKLVQAIKKHPLTRMLRVGKLTDMALEHTLRLFLHPETLMDHHPTLKMLTAEPAALKQKASRLKRRLDKSGVSLDSRVIEGESSVGGGSLPGVPIPTHVLAVKSSRLSAERLSYLLRQHEPPVIARIKEDEVLLDMRTLLDGEEKEVFEALVGVGREEGSE